MHGVNEYESSRSFENEPSEICSHLSEKEPKDRFFAPDKLQITQEMKRKGEKKKKKGRGGRKEEKRKKQRLFLPKKKNCLTKEVYLVLTF